MGQVHYFWPSDSIALEKFEKKWHEVTNQVGGQITSNTGGSESSNGVARFTFEYLCGRTWLGRQSSNY
ncbi:hypothetical protein GBA52_001077 [Prunus armeniaca]|nr:hypothetical protein GBA52_001077 [Prunus armeniaca]